MGTIKPRVRTPSRRDGPLRRRAASTSRSKESLATTSSAASLAQPARWHAMRRYPHLHRRGRRPAGVDARPVRLHAVRSLRARVPHGAMGLIEGAEFADDPEPPKRCLFALAECESCGRYYATNKEVAFANELLEQEEHADAARARALTSICPDCKRLHDAKAAARRSGMKRG